MAYAAGNPCPLLQTGTEEEAAAAKPKTTWVELALAKDTFGALTFALAQWQDETTRQEKGDVNIIMTFVVNFAAHMVSLCLQFLLMFMLVAFTVERQEDKFEVDLVSETQALHHAVATNTTLDGVRRYEETLALCSGDHNVPYSQSFVVFIWSMKCLPTLGQAIWATYVSFRMPTATAGDRKLIEQPADSSKKAQVRQLTLCMKIMLLAIVNIPRVLLIVFLWYMGAKFLMFAKSLGVLVTKAIGLAFILQVTEVLFAGSTSKVFQKEVEKLVLAYNSAMEFKDKWWSSWGANVFYFLTVASITLYYCRIVNGPLQHFREACDAYEKHFILSHCAHCGSHYFGYTFAV
eukprot:TRINITY_DN5998_c0_g1_i5.p1 TRINITY_DN5998_c0_g1~~TRINITY_DN5998_c0_g1_i5.p1  ORF type:complete len:375 (-),score=62.35 TRINITY_DN5998_c0_g1_i5:358-1401(-)